MQNRKKRDRKTNKSLIVDAGPVRDKPIENIYTKNVTQRIPWVDNAKAFGIIAVFYGHIVEKIFMAYSFPAAGLQYKLIYSFHMPLFFLLSGYLVKETQRQRFVAFMKNKFMTRIVPYFFFNLLILPCHFIDMELSHRGIDTGQFFQGFLYLFVGRPVFNTITWFLACLISVEVINYFLYPILSKSKIKLCMAIVLFYVIGWSLSYKADIINQTIPDYWYIYQALVAYSFYLFGILIATFPFFQEKMDPYLNTLLLMLTAVCVLATFTLNNVPFEESPVVSFSGCRYGSFFLFPLTAIAGSMCIISASALMPSSRFMSFLGRNTLSLMGLNGIFKVFVNNILIYYSMKIFSDNHFSVFMQCASVTGITLLLCVPFVILLKRYLPFMIGYRKEPGS